MKKILVVGVLICFILTLSISFAAKSTGTGISFTLEQFKMKVGGTQSISGVISGKNVDYSNVRSSNENVLKILDGYMLKAVSTGLSTLSYSMEDDEGNDKTIYCYVEVTRDYNTFDYVGGSVNGKIKVTLNIDGVSTTIESAKAGIPTYPEMSKQGYVLDGWYLNSDFTSKVAKDQRFNKDVDLYARWITEEEANSKLPKATPMYEDVVDHWARNAIESVSYLGLFKGVTETKFGPENRMTRAMTVAVLGRLDNNDNDGASVQGFKLDVKDVDNSSYYAPYLAWAINNKIVTDLEDGNFRPNDEITREEVAIYMANYINYKGYKNNAKIQILPSFSDVSDMSKEGKDAVDLLYCLNIMQGNPDNTFSPKASLTRAQIAQIFFNFNNFKMKYKG